MGTTKEGTNKSRNNFMTELRNLPIQVWKVIDNYMHAILFIDRNYKIQVFNQQASEQARRIYGRDIQLEDSIFLYMKDGDQSAFRQHFAKALNGETVSIEEELKRPGRLPLWFETHYKPIADDGGSIIGVSMTVADISDRKKNEASVNGSNQAFRALFDASAVGMALADNEERILHSNPAFQQMLGYTAEELLGRSFAEFAPLEDLAQHKDLIRQMREGERRHYEVAKRCLRKDKSIIRVHLMASLLPDTNGRSLIGLAMIRDVFDREISPLMTSISELITYQDKELKIVWANSAVGLTVGLKPEELTGRHCYEVWQQRRSPCPNCPVIRALADGKSHVEEMTTPDGRVWFIRGDPVKDAHGHVMGVVEVTQDITEKKSVEKVLHDSITQLRSIVDNTLDLIIQTDLHGIIQYASPSHERVLGHKPEDMLGKTLFDFLLPDDVSLVQTAILEGESTRQLGKMEIRCRCADGHVLWLETNANFIISPKGSVSGVVFGSRDVTERKKAEEELQQSYNSLRNTFEQTINALTLALGKRDPYTQGHQQRVTKLATAIAEELGLPALQVEGIRLAGILHDIGKILVPVELLSKMSKLTAAEADIMKTHPKGSHEILQAIDFPWPIAQIALQHHECMDGSGYPQGLKGEEILFEARIIGVADVVEAMTSHRPYRPDRGLKAALEEITSYRGVKYDAQVVDACVRLVKNKGFKFD